jgi:hypothetical protein
MMSTGASSHNENPSVRSGSSVTGPHLKEEIKSPFGQTLKYKVNQDSKASAPPRTPTNPRSLFSEYSDTSKDPLRKRELWGDNNRREIRRSKHKAGHEKIR